MSCECNKSVVRLDEIRLRCSLRFFLTVFFFFPFFFLKKKRTKQNDADSEMLVEDGPNRGFTVPRGCAAEVQVHDVWQ